MNLKKLLIQHGKYEHLQILKKFVQEKNLEYLAFVPTQNLPDNETKELINEIRSFVKIRTCENLIIDITDFDE